MLSQERMRQRKGRGQVQSVSHTFAVVFLSISLLNLKHSKSFMDSFSIWAGREASHCPQEMDVRLLRQHVTGLEPKTVTTT